MLLRYLAHEEMDFGLGSAEELSLEIKKWIIWLGKPGLATGLQQGEACGILPAVDKPEG